MAVVVACMGFAFETDGMALVWAEGVPIALDARISGCENMHWYDSVGFLAQAQPYVVVGNR